MFNHILLCTHGTQGAKKAEAFAFEKLETSPALKVSVLTILDEDWRAMTGDDWLNSSKTHATFLDHVEEQVNEEIQEEWKRIKTEYQAAKKADFIQKTGKIAETITTVARERDCDAIVIGAYQKKKSFLSRDAGKGLRDTLKNKNLHPLLPCPLIIIP